MPRRLTGDPKTSKYSQLLTGHQATVLVNGGAGGGAGGHAMKKSVWLSYRLIGRGTTESERGCVCWSAPGLRMRPPFPECTVPLTALLSVHRGHAGLRKGRGGPDESKYSDDDGDDKCVGTVLLTDASGTKASLDIALTLFYSQTAATIATSSPPSKCVRSYI
jgi:hypothetical protein